MESKEKTEGRKRLLTLVNIIGEGYGVVGTSVVIPHDQVSVTPLQKFEGEDPEDCMRKVINELEREGYGDRVCPEMNAYHILRDSSILDPCTWNVFCCVIPEDKYQEALRYLGSKALAGVD